jgi:hypothetical protein
MNSKCNRHSRTPEAIAGRPGTAIGSSRFNPHQHHDQWHQQQAQAPSGTPSVFRNSHPKSPPRKTIQLARGTAGGSARKAVTAFRSALPVPGLESIAQGIQGVCNRQET